jgi:hypothetical protein
MKEEPSTPDDAFFKRVTNLVLIELAKKFPDQADRAAALLGLVVDEIAAIEDREGCRYAKLHTESSTSVRWAMTRWRPWNVDG